jgi:ethanolamine utilization protein EutQ
MAKRLITVKEISEAVKRGEKVLYTDASTIVTPAARDEAASCGVTICDSSKNAPVNAAGGVSGGGGAGSVPSPAPAGAGSIDSDLIFKALQALLGSNVLGALGIQIPASDAPYRAERDPAGLKIVRGGTVKMEHLDTGNPANKVCYRECVCSKDSQVMNTGFLEIDSCSFDWNVGCDEMYYMIEGCLSITVNGATYTAYPGDIVNLPVGSKIVLGSSGKARMFYAIKAA